MLICSQTATRVIFDWHLNKLLTTESVNKTILLTYPRLIIAYDVMSSLFVQVDINWIATLLKKI